MGKIIAVANQKGGVGKTTTAVNLAASLGELGKKVLLIDMDPQGNATSGFGVEKEKLDITVYDLLLGECSVKDCLINEVLDNISLIPASVDLAAAEVDLINKKDKEYILRNEIDYIKDDYDLIIIDCPPSLNMLTINSMTTAESVMIPIQCEFYALEGLSQLIYTINLIKDRMNPKLDVDGVVFTMYDARTNLSAQVVDDVKANLQYYIYNTLIPRNVRLAEAPSYGMPITIYDPKSAGAEAYMKLAEETIEKNIRRGKNGSSK